MMSKPIEEWRRAQAQRAVRQLMSLDRPLSDAENERLAANFRTAYCSLPR